MHKRRMPTPSSPNLCIFCATHLFLSPSSSTLSRSLPHYAQKRYFQSSGIAERPEEAATVWNDDKEPTGGIPSLLSTKPAKLSWGEWSDVPYQPYQGQSHEKVVTAKSNAIEKTPVGAALPETEAEHVRGTSVDTTAPKISTEDEYSAVMHWKHVVRRDETQSKSTNAGERASNHTTSNHLEQEREKRLRETANGRFVGLAGLSAFASSSQFKVLVEPLKSVKPVEGPRRGESGVPKVRRVMYGSVKFEIRSGSTNTQQNNELLSQSPNTQTSDELSSQPPEFSKDDVATVGWKRWQPPKSETNHELSQQKSETSHKVSQQQIQVSAPRVRYNAFDKHNKIRYLEPNAPANKPSEFLWKSWSNPGPTLPAAANSGKVHAEERETYQQIASTYKEPGIRAERTRVGDRDRGRRRQQRRDEEEDMDEVVLARVERKRQRKKERSIQSLARPPTPIILPQYISVGNLATALRVRIEDFVHQMKSLGFEETNNDHILDAETAGLIAAEFNFEPVADVGAVEDLVAFPPPEDKTYLLQRPPVITIMGHVDHGKTTMLDWLRNSSVAASEHGGITQHIGAFMVPMPSGPVVTFLDTPGHAAFLSMRQRGANVTDIVVLVVAADDSVKPQTIEAINHAKAAGVPMIVAINKIDKPDADVERVKQDLARHGVEVEDFGGDTQTVCVSGKTGQGMEELEDAVVALADILDLRAPTDGQAEGWVLEATTRKAGRVATVLVRRGTITPGSVVVAGTTWARVRSLHDEAGQVLSSATPGMPVEIDGWREQPEAGDEVLQAPSEHRAKEVVELRVQRIEAEKLAKDVAAVNETRRLEQEKEEREAATAAAIAANPEAVFDDIVTPEMSKTKEIPFIVRADVSGSVEAVLDSITSLGNTEVRPTILRSAVGPISPTDIDHAAAAGGHIVSFGTPIDNNIRRMAETAGVSILDHNIIYRLVDDVRARLEDVLPRKETTRVVGEAEVAQVFAINVKGRVTVPVAGCRVRNGIVVKGSKVKVLRGGEVVYEGLISSLKHVKKDVTEMRKGGECGIGFEDFTAFQVGDQIQCYEEKTEKRRL